MQAAASANYVRGGHSVPVQLSLLHNAQPIVRVGQFLDDSHLQWLWMALHKVVFVLVVGKSVHDQVDIVLLNKLTSHQ